MPPPGSTPSARESELLESAYRYVGRHGLADLSLRPLASAIGSSPRVLLYLFGSKSGLIRALLARARVDELALLAQVTWESTGDQPGVYGVAEQIWSWLADQEHRGVLTIWLEAYALSLADPDGPWSGFAKATVDDWLNVLATTQPAAHRDTPQGRSERTQILSLLRGAMLDLLATGDAERVTAAVRHQLREFAGRRR